MLKNLLIPKNERKEFKEVVLGVLNKDSVNPHKNDSDTTYVYIKGESNQMINDLIKQSRKYNMVVEFIK